MKRILLLSLLALFSLTRCSGEQPKSTSVPQSAEVSSHSDTGTDLFPADNQTSDNMPSNTDAVTSSSQKS